MLTAQLEQTLGNITDGIVEPTTDIGNASGEQLLVPRVVRNLVQNGGDIMHSARAAVINEVQETSIVIVVELVDNLAHGNTRQLALKALNNLAALADALLGSEVILDALAVIEVEDDELTLLGDVGEISHVVFSFS